MCKCNRCFFSSWAFSFFNAWVFFQSYIYFNVGHFDKQLDWSYHVGIRANRKMRTLTFIIRASAALILVTLIFQACREVHAENGPSEYIQSASDNIVHNETESRLVTAESPATSDDDAWLISTRRLGYASWKDESTIDLKVSQYSDSGDWIESDLKKLLDSEPRKTVVYVHGNRIGFNEAIERAWNAFAVLQRDPAAPPMRLIIWSWPSDRIHGQLRDLRSKASRTNTEGQYLGWFLAQLDADTRVSMIGYSYGARIATGALHVLGGGTLYGQRTPLTTSAKRTRINVVLIAAAMHNHWLSPGGYHNRFSCVTDRVLVFYNSQDPILRRYRLIEKHARPVALGFAGARGLDDDLAARTEQYDVHCSVGKTHGEAAYLSSTAVVEGVQQIVRLNAVRGDN